ncbi:MAG TPA: transaldolase, partial [Roseiflexaceae bacterium]|nr:transaldolase [Roseiflexaceae bacterium]
MTSRDAEGSVMSSSDNYSRLLDVQSLGQSIWLDELRRGLLGKELARLIADDGVAGITSNPSIFAKAFAEDPSYAPHIAALRRSGLDGQHIYERLCFEDVRAAAQQLRRVYEQSDARDGYVSIEVPPAFAHDAKATVNEAHRLRDAIDAPNVMIKVPATDAGIVALRELIADGVNVNSTLIFGTRRYWQVAEAYMAGLEARVAAGKTLERVASVASLFVSRIDTHVDKALDAIENPARNARAQALRGKAAVAVARIAYQEFKNLLSAPRWQRLEVRHAMPQRPLWASTGTKDARYSDVKYVNELVGRDTVTTLPLSTLNAF